MFRQEILMSKCIYTDKSLQEQSVLFYKSNRKVESKHIYLNLEEFDHKNNWLIT